MGKERFTDELQVEAEEIFKEMRDNCPSEFINIAKERKEEAYG